MEYASPNAVLTGVQSEELSFNWSDDGESVALLRKREPLAMIVASKERGYSKTISKSGFYGEPWDQRLYEETFGK